MSKTTTLNLPPAIQIYGHSKSDIQREFFVEVGESYRRIYLGRTHLQVDGQPLENYLDLPEGIRMAFEILVQIDIKSHIRRLERLIVESTEELKLLREI